MKTGQRRMVHLSIWNSGQVARLSMPARLLYVGLIILGDDDGRLKGAPALIRSQIFPYDDNVKVGDVSQWLKEIETQNLIVKYEVEGEEYFFHPKWEDYQLLREDRRRDSNIPAPILEFFPMTTKRQPNDNHVADKVPPKISKDKISKENINTLAQETAFQSFWGAYPKKVGRKQAWKAWLKLKYTPELGQKIMQALALAVDSEGWQKDGGRYIPHPATWINGERWEDEVTPSKTKTKKYDNLNTKTIRG